MPTGVVPRESGSRPDKDESFFCSLEGGGQMVRLSVRKARPDDLEAVLDLWEEMMQYHARLDSRFRPAA
ncbi:MAG: hypothetical protein FJ026_06925, partial [Chloroflexi bacterium]|nr:hypothetical protein [Chloroflexota bacterium]